MPNLAVEMIGFSDLSFPAWVECRLLDAAGQRHSFIDKRPRFTAEVLAESILADVD